MWTVACVAKAFGVLPSVVARDLDVDPDQSALACLAMLNYAEAHAAFGRNNEAEMKAWSGTESMDRVIKNAGALVEREMAEAAEPTPGDATSEDEG